MAKKENTKKSDNREFVFIKDKELDDKTIFKLIELVLNSKLKGNLVVDIFLFLLAVSVVLLLIYFFK